MYGYAGSSAAAARVTPFAAPPSTTNPGRRGQPERRSHPGQRHSDWHRRAVVAIAADVYDYLVATEPRIARASSTSSTSLSTLTFRPSERTWSTSSSTTTPIVQGCVNDYERPLNSLHFAHHGWFFAVFGMDAIRAPYRYADEHRFTPAIPVAPAAGPRRRARRLRARRQLRAWGLPGAVLQAWADWRASGKQPQSARCRCRRAGAGPRHLRRR